MAVTRSRARAAQAANAKCEKRHAPPTPTTEFMKKAKRKKTIRTNNARTARKVKWKATTPANIFSTASLDDPKSEYIPSPKPRTFGQDITIPRYPTVEEMGMLEFYQAYPHNRGATLCITHFLYLAMKWYQRRRPGAETRRMQIKAYSDDFGGDSEPDFSQLPIPVRNDGLLVSLQEFTGCILNSVSAAKRRLLEQRGRVLEVASEVVVCEVSGGEPLSCSLCVDNTEKIKLDEGIASSLLDDSFHCFWDQDSKRRLKLQFIEDNHLSGCVVLEGGDGDIFQCDKCPLTRSSGTTGCWTKSAIRQAGKLFPVEVYPRRMALNSDVGKASVGGLHFIVDTCEGEPMIKFLSTKFSEAHEADRCAAPRKGLVCEQLCDVLNIFKPTECSAFFDNCVCAIAKV